MGDVTAAQVRKIIDTEISDSDFATTYIPMADAMMARILARAAAEEISIDDDLDTTLRKLLTAHYASATRDPEAGSLIEVRVDTVYTRVAGGVGTKDMFGAGLKMTRYGSQAIALDPTGLLGELSSNLPEATIDVIELPDPEEGVVE